MKAMLAYERKITGNNPIWVILTVLTVFTLACLSGGDLVNWAYLGFEILLPFFVSIMVCEWVKTLSDPLMDVIAVHADSLFRWVAGRYLFVFGLASLLCLMCMAVLRVAVLDFSFFELVTVFLSTAFFFSSLGVFTSFLSRQPHAATALCGMVWLFCLLLMQGFVENLVRFPVVACVYPFIRSATPDNPIWPANKTILFLLGIVLWIWIFHVCRKRKFYL